MFFYSSSVFKSEITLFVSVRPFRYTIPLPSLVPESLGPMYSNLGSRGWTVDTLSKSKDTEAKEKTFNLITIVVRGS